MGSEPSFDRLLEDKFLLTDEATGTNLFLKGLLTGDAPELWNLNQPKKEKLMDLEEQFPTYKAIDFLPMYR